MDQTSAFLLGFGIAGITGWLANFYRLRLAAIFAFYGRMFAIPIPALRPVPNAGSSGISTNPDISPIEILRQGCLGIISQIIILAIVTVMVAFIGLSLDVDIFRSQFQLDFLVGIFYAPPFVLLLTRIQANWRAIRNLYNRMVNPPAPALNRDSPPNNFTVAARPTISAFAAVFDGLFEIAWRLILQMFLLYSLYLLFRFTYFYLSGGLNRYSEFLLFGR
jgi:hypothetical protein